MKLNQVSKMCSVMFMYSVYTSVTADGRGPAGNVHGFLVLQSGSC